ncbi:MAG: efflux RND transporter periplasmic adaptor subunit [Candidatus Acidiferrales bacterium]
MNGRILVGSAGVVLTLTLAACKSEAPPPPPPPEVKVAEVLQRDVPVYIEAIGETRGSTEIEIRARVEGFIESVDFEEGTFVRKGQLLYTIDPKPYEAALSQAQGSLAVAEADQARAHQDVARYEPLVAKNAISREQYETAVAVERAAAAAVEAARAAVQGAEVNLSYTKVLAPESGLVGKTEVHPGTLVGRGQSTLLTQISQIETIHVRITIPEKDYLYYARRRAQGGREAGKGAMEIVLADGTVHPHPGRLVFVDRTVDPLTGTILLEAAFPNPGGIVRPGQYGRVRAVVDFKPGAILVPQRSVQEIQGIYNVVVVGPDSTAEFRPVKPAERIGGLWVIDSGLKPGERIIVEGLQKVRPGSKVNAQATTIEEGDAGASPGGSPPAAGGSKAN